MTTNPQTDPLAAAHTTNQRLNLRVQRLESELAAYRRAVRQWEINDQMTYVPLRSLAVIAKAAGLAVPERWELHYQRVERLEAAAVSVPAPAPTDEAALVDLAAQAIRDSNGSPEALEWWRTHPQLIPAHVYAAAVLAVLPANRAAIRAEVAELVRAMADEHPSNAAWVQDCQHIADRIAAASGSGRVADETQAETESGCAHCGGPHAWDDCAEYTALAASEQQPETQSALKRAHVALAAQAGRDQAAINRVRAYLASQTDAFPEGYPVAVPAADVLAALDEQPAVVSQPDGEA